MMHLKKIIRKDNKYFIENYVIVDAIDSAEIYYEELNMINYIKYFFTQLRRWLRP